MKTLIVISSILLASTFIVNGQSPGEKAAQKKAIQDSIQAARASQRAAQMATQSQMNQGAGSGAQKADQELNALYQKILKDYASDTSFISHLKAAERLWIQFRDAEVLVKFPPHNNYGSAAPMCMAGYKEQLIRERIKTLKLWADGIEEGDMCNGSVKIKH